MSGDFTFQVRIQEHFSELYDQAGVLLVADDRDWLKVGIGFNDGAPAIGSVLTRGFSGRATGIFTSDVGDFWLRLQYSSAGASGRYCGCAIFPIRLCGRRDVLHASAKRAGSEFY